MKTPIAMTIGLFLMGGVAQAGMVDMPIQKPGLWQMTVTNSRMPGGRGFQICEDAAFIAAAKASSEAHLKNDCTRTSSVRKVGDTWVSDMDCTMSGMHIISHSVTTAHGDGQYHTDVTSRTMMKGAGAETSMSMDNKWLGPCKPGQKVGVPAAVR